MASLRILVTGHGGRVGGPVARHLSARGSAPAPAGPVTGATHQRSRATHVWDARTVIL